MRAPETVQAIHQDRGAKGLPLERVYKHLFNPDLFLLAYGKLYRNRGAMTKGTTAETVDGMSLGKIDTIIALLRQERYTWSPVRRTEIPKPNGKKRPLGIPTWSDKLVQESLRTILEPYYEQKFSDNSFGFRPKRGAQHALLQIQRTWKGTTWFIEGDIKGCFDNIDHMILLEILRRDIHDGRVITLIDNLLKAGYMKDLQWLMTTLGSPQGSVISPLLANIYMTELDRFVEDTLIPEYTRGDRRRHNPEYVKLTTALAKARKLNDPQRIKECRLALRTVPSKDCYDPDYRRLRYVRYADDFLLGFTGPKNEAEQIRERIRDFLRDSLKLTLSEEKTLITHAASDKAKFLGYEVTTQRFNSLLTDGGRATNGVISLRMPQNAVTKMMGLYSKNGKIVHRPEVTADSDYTITQRYQSVLSGVYNYYCLASNVSRRMAGISRILETSLVRTLAHKNKCSVATIYQRHKVVNATPRCLRVTLPRPDKEPLIALFGGIPFIRKPEGMGAPPLRYDVRWYGPGGDRSEIVDRLHTDTCENCGGGRPFVVHHVRGMADLNRPGRKPKAEWEKIMSARRRKTLVVCVPCHHKIHAGEHDGPSTRQRSLESRVH